MVGWAAFLGSWLMNILFYKVHPSSVDFSYREKLYIHILGEKRLLWGYRDPKGRKERTNQKFFFTKIICTQVIQKRRKVSVRN